MQENGGKISIKEPIAQEMLDQVVQYKNYVDTLANGLRKCPVLRDLGMAALETAVETYKVLSDVDADGKERTESEITDAESALILQLRAKKTANQTSTIPMANAVPGWRSDLANRGPSPVCSISGITKNKVASQAAPSK